MDVQKKVKIMLPLVFTVAFTGCKKSGDDTQDTAADAGSDIPTYTVAMNTDYPPFEYISEDGGLTGFDIELLNAIAEKENFKVKYEPYPFDKILPAVQNGDEDMSASSIFISDDRRELVDYSQPYFSMPMYVVGLEKDGRPEQITDISGKTIAIEDHFLLDKITQEHFVPQDNEIIKVGTHYLAYEKMYTGKVDLMIENIMSIKDHSKFDNKKPIFFLPLPDENSIQLGYVTKKGNTELMTKLNSGLEKIKADGTYNAINNKWFGEMKKQVKEASSE